MAQKINITIEGNELEMIVLSLDENQVESMYLNNKEKSKTIDELTKKIEIIEKNAKYTTDNLSEARKELENANVLLTALDVQEKTNHEQDYYKTALPVSIRIALYIAKNGKVN